MNVLTGILIGPWQGALVATLVGLIRNAFAIGTIFAFPGGIPGAIVVGLAYKLTRRFRRRSARYSAAILEPIGTVIIGATLSLFIVAPLIGWKPMLSAIDTYGPLLALATLWAGWAVSSIPGCIIGYFTVLALDKIGLLERVG